MYGGDDYVDHANDEILTMAMIETTEALENLDEILTVPVNFIQELNVPVILHHATGDPSVPYMWSESLAARLFTHQKPFEFYTYKSNNHLFKDENKRLAYERDINFFNKYIKQEQSSM